MIKSIVLSLLLAALPAHAVPEPAPGPVGHQPKEEAAVLAVMDRYLTAISARDLKTLHEMQMPGSMTWRARAAEGGAMEVLPRPGSYWTDPANDDGTKLRERYWTPTVLIRGSIAVVWAPYEFWRDGKTSHCGVDVFDFVKVDGTWRLSNSMWTVEPDSCAELRPSDPSQIRPADASHSN